MVRPGSPRRRRALAPAAARCRRNEARRGRTRARLLASVRVPIELLGGLASRCGEQVPARTAPRLDGNLVRPGELLFQFDGAYRDIVPMVEAQRDGVERGRDLV